MSIPKGVISSGMFCTPKYFLDKPDLGGWVAVDEAGEVRLLVVPGVHAVRLQLDLRRICENDRKRNRKVGQRSESIITFAASQSDCYCAIRLPINSSRFHAAKGSEKWTLITM